jgi:transposase
VFFFDEGRFGLKPTLGRHWARRGVRPLAWVNPGYENFYVYSAVAPKPGEAFSLFLPWVNTQAMNVYLEELAAAYPDKRILLIWDGAGWHESKGLRIPDNIRCEALPPYSPELNPVERLWQWLRRHVTRNQLFDSQEALMDRLADALRKPEPALLGSLCRCGYL